MSRQKNSKIDYLLKRYKSYLDFINEAHNLNLNLKVKLIK